ncbi:YqzE family protein [Paenibacillus sp. IB182496]|uniref:YqzE family protein n=1 Tax=Paenibacillus sabuli TaxID=2772509 RepID=A0A927BYN0_9BACL|nr:YqzE family protein [Paenibacillus sabuli]MBD2847909.1 YqzE family protein [Paenibacillus sabuli]
MAKEGSEWVKYMTKRVATYMDLPSDERKARRQAARVKREPWLSRWFGIAPLGIRLWWSRRKGKRSG